MLHPKVGGKWLRTIGAFGPVTVEYGIHGSEAASWEMDISTHHPLLRGGTPVEVYDGGWCIWSGTMLQPGSDGEFSAAGLWHEAEASPAINFSGDPTTSPYTAVAEAVVRGDLTWTYDPALSSTSWATTATGEMNVAQVLDGYSAEMGAYWSITPNKLLQIAVLPTVAAWHVPHSVAGRGLTPSEDEFYTHLVGRYMSGTGTYATRTIGSAETAAAFRRRTGIVDLTDLGIITAARADSILNGMFLRSGARMGWAEGLELSWGQITTPGGIPASLAQVQAGQMIRLRGTVDTSRANQLPGYTDIVIRTSKYTDGSDAISLTPMGYAARNLEEVLSVALEDA